MDRRSPDRRSAAVHAGRLLAAGIGACSAIAAHAQTASIGISATVEAACQSSAGDGDGSLDFGTLDFGSYGSLDSAISAASSEGSGSIKVTCVAGQSYAILLDGGSSGTTANRQMVAQSGNDVRIAYNLFTDPGHGQVWDDSTGVSATGTGSEQVHTVYGLVQAQSTPAAGTYADTVNVTISW